MTNGFSRSSSAPPADHLRHVVDVTQLGLARDQHHQRLRGVRGHLEELALVHDLERQIVGRARHAWRRDEVDVGERVGQLRRLPRELQGEVLHLAVAGVQVVEVRHAGAHVGPAAAGLDRGVAVAVVQREVAGRGLERLLHQVAGDLHEVLVLEGAAVREQELAGLLGHDPAAHDLEDALRLVVELPQSVVVGELDQRVHGRHPERRHGRGRNRGPARGGTLAPGRGRRDSHAGGGRWAWSGPGVRS